MVQLKRKIKLKQKIEPSKPKPFFSKKAIAGMATIGILGVGGLSYAIYEHFNNDGITANINENDPIEANEGKVLHPDSIVKEKSDTIVDETEGNDAASSNITIDEPQSVTRQDTDISNSNNQNVKGDLEQEALSVIRGNYGNNPVRRRKLGERYQEIQDRVNQMYREGKVQ